MSTRARETCRRGWLDGTLLVAAGLLALSFLAYALMFVVIAFGTVRFYSLGEHVLVLVYCVTSYAACRASWFGWRAAEARRLWRPVMASYAIAALATSAEFAAMRLSRGADVRAWVVAANALLTSLLLHSTVAAAWFTARHFELRRAASDGQARAERAAELRSLRQQFDPHFLFNNLSILGSLVRSDPERAERFVERLTALYRYQVRHHRADWIDLDEEIEFARSYARVLEARFGRAFRLAITVPGGTGVYVIPGLLQELLSNVVKHNEASEDAPVEIELRLEGERLVASNSLRPKRYAEPRTGAGLSALSERYRLQTGEPLAWHAGDHRFVVAVPLVTGAP